MRHLEPRLTRLGGGCTQVCAPAWPIETENRAVNPFVMVFINTSSLASRRVSGTIRCEATARLRLAGSAPRPPFSSSFLSRHLGL